MNDSNNSRCVVCGGEVPPGWLVCRQCVMDTFGLREDNRYDGPLPPGAVTLQEQLRRLEMELPTKEDIDG